MSNAARRRGQPLMVLCALLLAWTGWRVAVWEAPWPQPARLVQTGPLGLAAVTVARAAARSTAPREVASPPAWLAAAPLPVPVRPLLALPTRSLPSERPAAQVPNAAMTRGTASGHTLLWMAAMAHLPIPGEVARLLDARSAPVLAGTTPAQPLTGASGSDRWSIDGWLLLRQGVSRGAAGSAFPASYGASQAGAILRYRLAPARTWDPAAYLRAGDALVRDGESELALGLAVRPLASVPARLHAELRAVRQDGRTELRPALFASAGFARGDLPLGLDATGYAQAGYVGGRHATAFADGQMAVTGEVARFDLGRISAGAGGWGGAQKGAARFDIGPTARVDVTLGEVPARLSLDYRVRVAGDAAPGSGAALTLSTSF